MDLPSVYLLESFSARIVPYLSPRQSLFGLSRESKQQNWQRRSTVDCGSVVPTEIHRTHRTQHASEKINTDNLMTARISTEN